MKITTIKMLSLTALLGLTAAGHAQTWWNNGPTVTHVGIGAGGNDISAFNQDPLTTTFGLQMSYNARTTGPGYLADDYTVGSSDEMITRMRIRWYGVENPDPVAARFFLKVFDGVPVDGSAPIWSDFSAGNMESSDDYTNPETGHAVYRTSGSTGDAATSTLRKIQQSTVRLGDGLRLTANHRYYFAWSIDSPSATSLFSPTMARRGNGRQQLVLNGNPTWGDALGTAIDPDSDVDLPFELEVTPVPEPATCLVFAAGGLALMRRRRK